ncbi:MAG: hypothetical protein M0041_08080 [Nitrospiraceae bacterium]|nr:hypothetical protein [Nitrospiraceae bacterium]
MTVIGDAHAKEPGIVSDRWVLLVDGAGTALGQMARDKELSSLVKPGRTGILRLYRISSGATVGRTWSGVIPPDWGLPPETIALRQTGGGAVLHGQDLCLSLFFPRNAISPESRNWPLFYERLHAAFADFLLWAGYSTTMESRCTSTSPSDNSSSKASSGSFCFRESVRGDLMQNGVKVLGGALAVGRGAIVYQGSLQIPGENPEVLSGLFEEWYCSIGRDRIDKALMAKEIAGGRGGPFCPD